MGQNFYTLTEFWNQKQRVELDWVQILGIPLVTCVTISKLLNLSGIPRMGIKTAKASQSC